jgi:hypothetical protein
MLRHAFSVLPINRAGGGKMGWIYRAILFLSGHIYHISLDLKWTTNLLTLKVWNKWSVFRDENIFSKLVDVLIWG